MKSNQNTIIGDIIEINNDIIKQKREIELEEKFTIRKAILGKIRYRYYKHKLYKIIEKIKNIIFTKANISELLTYIHAYYNGKYRNVQRVTLTNTSECNTTSAEIVIGSFNNNINSVVYYITIYSNSPLISIRCNICHINGTVQTILYNRDNLHYEVDDIEYISEECIRRLNRTLQNILYNFLKEYLDQHNEIGYVKEV